MTATCEGPAGAVSVLLAPSWLMAEPRINKRCQITCLAIDITQPGAAEEIARQIASRGLYVDELINNAGIGAHATIEQTAEETFDRLFNVQFKGVYFLTQKAIPLMSDNGRIINVSSVEGKIGKPVFTAYTAAKHAVNGMTKSLAQEVGTLGVTVNAICPGLVITDIVRENGPATAEAMGMTFEEMVDLFSQESAIKRPNTVEEVAAMAVLLASEAGGGITGAQLSVDGGTAPY